MGEVRYRRCGQIKCPQTGHPRTYCMAVSTSGRQLTPTVRYGKTRFVLLGYEILLQMRICAYTLKCIEGLKNCLKLGCVQPGIQTGHPRTGRKMFNSTLDTNRSSKDRCKEVRFNLGYKQVFQGQVARLSLCSHNSARFI
jgi:hypothetical protein